MKVSGHLHVPADLSPGKEHTESFWVNLVLVHTGR